MGTDETADWLVQLYEEQGTTLHRLVVLLGAEDESGRIVRSAMLALHRRGSRLIDPQERVEFLEEHAVHLARSARTVHAPIVLPQVADVRQNELLKAVSQLPERTAELLIVSHYLSAFGPELAAIMRMSVRGCNQKLEAARVALRKVVPEGVDPTAPAGIESLSQELTAALRAAAREVQAPGTGTLEGELRQLSGHYRRTLGPRFVVVLTVAAILLGFALAVITRPRPSATVVPSVPVSAAPSVSASRSLPAQVQDVAVYYLGRSDGLLYREERDLPSAENLLSSVVEAVLTLVPLDPDYESAWGPGQLLHVEQAADTITVDLSAEAYADLTDPVRAQQAREQLVFSVSALVDDPTTTVFFLQDGSTPPRDFQSDKGFTITGSSLRAPVQITSPRNQAQVEVGQVIIAGLVRSGAPAPTVTIIDVDSGAELSSVEAELVGEPTAGGMQGWESSVSLGAGNYTIEATTTVSTPPVEVLDNKTIKIS